MRTLSVVAALALSLFSFGALAQEGEKYLEGVHYHKLSAPLRTSAPASKVEVAEIFWYGCGHCYNFESTINAWNENKPEGAELVKIPGTWQKEHAKLYYLADLFGIADTAHQKIFEKMHNDPKRQPHQMLRTKGEMKKFFTELGVDPADFDKEYNGGSLKIGLAYADSNSRSLSKQMGKKGVRVSTPSIVVNGEYYVVLSKEVPRFHHLMEVTNFLVAKSLAAK